MCILDVLGTAAACPPCGFGDWLLLSKMCWGKRVEALVGSWCWRRWLNGERRNQWGGSRRKWEVIYQEMKFSGVGARAKQYVHVLITWNVTLREAKKENEKVSFRNVRASFDTGDLILFFFPSEIMSRLQDVRYLYGALRIKGEEQVNLLPLFGVGPLCLWFHNKTIY